MKITSRDNSLLRRARAVRDGKANESIFVEGLRLCEEALSSRLKIEAAIYSEEIARKERAAELIERLQVSGAKTASVSEKLLESISFTKTPQGIVVLAGRPTISEDEFKVRQPVTPVLVLMHGINNPVNVGAIIRTAEAAGVTGIIATTNASDPFSAKALRGAMGSAFRLPIWTGATYAEVLAWCVERGIRTISSDARASRDYTLVDWTRACALIVGPESTGLASNEIEQADETVRIPMKGAVESLNVAVATGILLYEAARQRAQK
jgi:TrmH family RNA methyltransferase